MATGKGGAEGATVNEVGTDSTLAHALTKGMDATAIQLHLDYAEGIDAD